MEYPSPAKRRKPPTERYDEMVVLASAIALSEGLGSLTLRRVAQALSVAPGLVSHYFPNVDDLVAAAFSHAVGEERAGIFAALALETDPVQQMRALLAMLLDEQSDAVSLLWLDGWQASRQRPALQRAVTGQMLAWRQDLAGLIERGCLAELFQVGDPAECALRILALIDGLSVQAAIRRGISYASVREMVVANCERELGLMPGALRDHA
jgi:AcrR family transcriptional regulator